MIGPRLLVQIIEPPVFANSVNRPCKRAGTVLYRSLDSRFFAEGHRRAEL
jgi:hypothetical protein